MLIDSAEAVADYTTSPPWMKQLMDGFADGINYYLYTHKEVRPLLLRKFKPWYSLLWTDGSIGAISTGGLTNADLERLYGDSATREVTVLQKEDNSTIGSNGFAMAPTRTASQHAILYMNSPCKLLFPS